MISVIVPVHNTKAYIQECLDSILMQAYKEIEIICIDSSTDGTSDLLRRYAQSKPQIKYISDDNSSYGHKLNIGFRMAGGEYIGIVDSDDYIEPDMYQTLLFYAEKYGVDFVKSDYSSFYVENGVKQIFRSDLSAADISIYGKVFNCSEYPDLLYHNAVSIWTGLYRKDFILQKGIFLHESEGASFQDTGFSIFSHIFADKIYYLNKSFYRYRTDNIKSSVKSQEKNKLIADESRWIDCQVEKSKLGNSEIQFALRMKKIVSYHWNFDRLSRDAALDFADYVHEELENQYIRTGIVNQMPKSIRMCFEKIYHARKEYEKNHKELEERIGRHSVPNNQPVISVIIPVYNTELYLQECLLSVLEQSEKNIEVICINDGSTDHSLDILEEIASLDARMIVINQQHLGQAYSRNAAFSKAKGKYIIYLDSDDLFRKNAFSELLDVSEKNAADIVYFDAECLFEQGIGYEEEKERYYWRRKSYGLRPGKEIFACTMMYDRFTDSACLMMINRQWLDEHKISFYDGILYEDCLFSVQCMLKAERVFHTNKKYYKYRIRENSTMTSNPYRAENLYSRAIGLQHFLEIYKNEVFTEFQKEAFIKWITGIIYNIKVIGQNISENEMERFYYMPKADSLKLELALGEISWERVSAKYNRIQKWKVLNNAKNMIIYGAGIRGKRLLAYFQLLDNADRVKGFLVTAQEGNPKTVRGIKVESIDKIGCIQKNTWIIIAIRGDSAIDLKDDLEQRGYKQVIILDDEMNRIVCRKIRQELKL